MMLSFCLMTSWASWMSAGMAEARFLTTSPRRLGSTMTRFFRPGTLVALSTIDSSSSTIPMILMVLLLSVFLT